MGSASSAAKAVKELNERRARGERVYVVSNRGTRVVRSL